MLINNLKTEYLDSEVLSLENLDKFISKDSNRYKHIIGVINLAKEIENTISFNGDLIQAALYHDIGYSDSLQYTKFHPIDSALKAEADNISPNIKNAILCHTGARGEANLINKDLMIYYKFIEEDFKLANFLTYCDTHINSKGEKVSLNERLNDIYERYDKNHYVYKNIKKHEKYFKEIEKNIEREI